jgi:hypothetical protein
LLASNNFSFRLQKQPQYLEWLVLNRHTHPGAKQFTTAQIDSERFKTYGRPTERTECSQRKTSTKVNESVPQLPVEPVNSKAPRRSQPPHFRAVAQFTTSSPLDSPAVHCASLQAMRWCSQTVDSISGLEHQDLNSPAKKYGGTMKFRISLLLLTFALAASSTLTAHAACNNLTIKGTYAFNPRNSFPSGRVYPTH